MKNNISDTVAGTKNFILPFYGQNIVHFKLPHQRYYNLFTIAELTDRGDFLLFTFCPSPFLSNRRGKCQSNDLRHNQDTQPVFLPYILLLI